MLRILLIVCLASAIICVSSGSPGTPGSPGGSSGGRGGAGGNGGGSRGGSGGSDGMPGLPGGDDYDYDYDYDMITDEDLTRIFGHSRSHGGAGGSGGSAAGSRSSKIRVGPECANVAGVREFLQSRKDKKEKWLGFLMKLVADGKNGCAKELSNQIFRD